MDNSKDKDSQLIGIIKQLLKNEIDNNLSSKIIEDLKQIYKDEKYRHSYSNITTTILTHSKNIENSIECFEILGQNLRTLKEKILTDEDPKSDFILKFNKLLDHINLEIIRIDYIGDIKNIRTEIARINRKAKQIRTEIRQSTQEATKSFITILGIFASIIIAFVSGLTFSNSALSNIKETNILKLLIIISFIAMFITNILNFLFYFIKTIHFGKEFKEPMLNYGIIIFNLMIFCLIIVLIIQGNFISIR